jgi:hypothetical protein
VAKINMEKKERVINHLRRMIINTKKTNLEDPRKILLRPIIVEKRRMSMFCLWIMMLQRNLIIIENDILSFYKFIFVGIMNN